MKNYLLFILGSSIIFSSNNQAAQIKIEKSQENNASLKLDELLYVIENPFSQSQQFSPQKEIDEINLEEEEKSSYLVVRKKESPFLAMIKTVAEELDITLTSFSGDYLIILKDKLGNECQILGYRFSINTVTASEICGDKPLTFDMLKSSNVPAISHKIFIDPRKTNWVTDKGTLAPLLNYCKSFPNGVVIKPKKGSQGESIFYCKTVREIEAAAIGVFSKTYGLSISPFHSLVAEYRLVMLNGSNLLIYRKDRPSIVGDGISTIYELFTNFVITYMKEESNIKFLKKILSTQDFLKEEMLDNIPEKGEKVDLTWKNNLSRGGRASLDIENDLKKELVEIAKQATSAVGISFASVDIAHINNEDESDNMQPHLKVLEVNSGVVLTIFSEQIEDGFTIAKDIYKKAIEETFQSSNKIS